MEINITTFFRDEEPSNYSASCAELGDNAGRITFNAAKEAATAYEFLNTEEIRQAFRDCVADFGAWDEEEIKAWDNAELEALFIQLISGDLRTLFNLCSNEEGEIDWNAVEEESQAGQIGGNIFKADNGDVYYYIGN